MIQSRHCSSRYGAYSLEVPVCKFVRQLGHCFEKHTKEHMGTIGTDILDSMWTLIHKIDSTYHYMACVQQWLPLSISNLPVGKRRLYFVLRFSSRSIRKTLVLSYAGETNRLLIGKNRSAHGEREGSRTLLSAVGEYR